MELLQLNRRDPEVLRLHGTAQTPCDGLSGQDTQRSFDHEAVGHAKRHWMGLLHGWHVWWRRIAHFIAM